MSKHFNEAVEGDDGGLVICRGCKARGTYAEPPSGECPTPCKSDAILLAESMAREQALQQRLNAADQRIDELTPPPGWKLVPIQPTPEMLSTISIDAKEPALAQRHAEQNWLAMIGVAPDRVEHAPPIATVLLPDRLGSPESIKAVLETVGRAGRVAYWDARDIWNACLDATFALNSKTKAKSQPDFSMIDIERMPPMEYDEP